ncbi:sensor histidine kinase [Actinomadura harenae]|uniref:histidine kinase n=1 Tax=Actinomadura harenae TaxID=2483351 RepID=A0A3M2M3S2_9ACTN|nr:sensor histidine kinase [Actinomadura harenae]
MPAAVVDGVLTLLVAGIVELMVYVSQDPRERPAIPRDYVLGALLPLPVLLHRRRPMTSLLLAGFLLTAYFASGAPGFSPIWVVGVPTFSAVLAGYLRWATGINAFFFGFGFLAVIRKGDPPATAVAAFLQQWALVTVVILLAEVIRSRRALAAETRERLRMAGEEKEREAARRAAEERLRIARDLHDTVAHGMATITVQAGAALRRLADHPADDPVRAAVAAIRASSKESLAQLRATLGLLRGDGDGPRAPGLGRLPSLVDAVRSAGLPVEVEVSGTAVPLDAATDEAAYRILQESLTNVLRHAGDTATARITIDHSGRDVRVEIADDGPGGTQGSDADASGGGHGLTGMRERAEAVGGTLTAAPGPDRGFRVVAVLPAAPAAPADTPGGVLRGE